MTTIALPEGYGYVPLAVSFIGLVQFYMGTGVMAMRKKVFRSKEFLENPKVKAIQEEHKKAFGTEINNFGYPDTGTGRYADQLSQEDWVGLNNAVRSHMNMVEFTGPVLAAIVVGGLYFPRVCSALGFSFGLGRLLYAQGYQSKRGADGRMIGAVLGALSTFSLYGICAFVGISSSGILNAVLKK